MVQNSRSIRTSSYRRVNGRSKLKLSQLTIRSGGTKDENIVFEMYQQSPKYCYALGEAPRHAKDVEGEQLAISVDSKHHRDIILYKGGGSLTDVQDYETKNQVVGFVDYKVDYPKKGEVLVNLLLLSEKVHRQGFGKKVMTELEERLRQKGFHSISAFVLGGGAPSNRVSSKIGVKVPRESIANTKSVIKFWKSIGYKHNKDMAKDSKYLLNWYSKSLKSQV